MSLHPIRIEGTFELSDGSRTQFTLDLENGWMQWGNDQGKLGCTVDLLDAIEDVAGEHGLGEPREDHEEDEEDEEDARERLEYLRGQLRAERISWGELSELQNLAAYIEPGDVELLEAAGVPEFPAGEVDDDS